MLYRSSNLGLGPDVPIWPPAIGLLAPAWMLRPREEWTAREWAMYAKMLEDSGHDLVAQLERAQAELAELRTKLTRASRKAKVVHAYGLLDPGLWPTPLRRGRRQGSKAEDVATLALAVKEEMQRATKKRVTDKAALAEHYRRSNLRQNRAELDRSVINAMSRLRKSQKLG